MPRLVHNKKFRCPKCRRSVPVEFKKKNWKGEEVCRWCATGALVGGRP